MKKWVTVNFFPASFLPIMPHGSILFKLFSLAISKNSCASCFGTSTTLNAVGGFWRHLSHSILIFACFSFVVLLRKRWSIVLTLQSFLTSFFLENDGDDVECEVGPDFALFLSLFVFTFTPLAGLATSGSPPLFFFASSV